MTAGIREGHIIRERREQERHKDTIGLAAESLTSAPTMKSALALVERLAGHPELLASLLLRLATR